MQRRIIVIPGAVFMLAALTPLAIAQAPTLSMDDFAYGSELTPVESHFRRFVLTPTMIQSVKRRDLGDVRVFDEDNELMPVLVRKNNSDIKTSRQQLAFVPHVVKGKTVGFVLDRTKDHQQWLKSLQLQWKKNAAPNVLSVKIENSADLVSWKTLKKSEVVSNYKFGNTMLRHNVIDIDSYTQRYIRIAFLQRKNVPPVLESVNSFISSAKPYKPAWIAAGKLKPQAGKPGSYQFSVSEGVNPRLLKMSFSALNTVLTGSLYAVLSSNGQQQRKLVTNNFSAYKITLNNKVVRSKPIDLSRWQATNWLITADAGSNVEANGLPKVMVAYPTYEVIFAAEGDEPYTVVWGNRKAGAPVLSDINSGQDVIQVRHGRIFKTDELTERVESARFPWLTILIVLGVILIVAATGWFGYRRYLEARNAEPVDHKSRHTF